MVEYKVITTTIPSGTNTATFTDALIGSDTKIDVYTTDDDTIIENQEQSGSTITITVSNHINDLGIALVINNVEEYEPYNDASVVQAINGLTNRVLNNEVDIENINQDLSALDGMVTDLETEVESKQDILTPGENITIVNNVISASGSGGFVVENISDLITKNETDFTWTRIVGFKYGKLIVVSGYGALKVDCQGNKLLFTLPNNIAPIVLQEGGPVGLWGKPVGSNIQGPGVCFTRIRRDTYQTFPTNSITIYFYDNGYKKDTYFFFNFSFICE